MLQKESKLLIVDNSGGKIFKCLSFKYNRKYGVLNSLVTGSIQSLRKYRKKYSKVKKREKVKGLIIQTIGLFSFKSKFQICSNYNKIILINKKIEPLGTRIFSPIPKQNRLKKRSKLILIAPALY